MRDARRTGFTLIESVAVLAVVTLLAGVLAPAVHRTRTDMRGAGSAANLAFIGQGAAMYALDHEGRIFNYTWAVPDDGPLFVKMPDGRNRAAFNDMEASVLQQTEILLRRTGRIDGPTRFRISYNRIAQRRTLPLVLQDYLNRPFPDPMVADPSDANLLQWQANPTDITVDNNIPYAPGSDTSQYDSASGWTDFGVLQRWAFSSSYQTTMAAWNPYDLSMPAYRPVESTPHLFVSSGGAVRLSQTRTFDEVAFPSAKVYFFEEFDRRQAGSPYFAYDHARPMKLMFDGSVNDRASGEAAPSVHPDQGRQEWRQRYVPLHTFPLPITGFGEETPLSMRYRWTYRGLRGIDYPMIAPGGFVPAR